VCSLHYLHSALFKGCYTCARMFPLLCIHASMVSNIPSSRSQRTCFSPSAATPCKHNAKTIPLRGGLTSTRNSKLISTLLSMLSRVQLMSGGIHSIEFCIPMLFSAHTFTPSTHLFAVHNKLYYFVSIYICFLPHTTCPCRQHAGTLSITTAFALHHHVTVCSCV
jgi:hypothetical protein